jgi:hypothetical protein
MLRRTCHVCTQKQNLYVKEGVPVNWFFFWVEMCNLLFGSKLTISRRNRN